MNHVPAPRTGDLLRIDGTAGTVVVVDEPPEPASPSTG